MDWRLWGEKALARVSKERPGHGLDEGRGDMTWKLPLIVSPMKMAWIVGVGVRKSEELPSDRFHASWIQPVNIIFIVRQGEFDLQVRCVLYRIKGCEWASSPPRRKIGLEASAVKIGFFRTSLKLEWDTGHLSSFLSHFPKVIRLLVTG